MIRELMSQLERAKAAIRAIPGNPQDGEDLYQDVWVACLERASAYDWSNPQDGRIRNMARNLWIRERRRRQVRHTESIVTDPPETTGIPPAAGQEAVEREAIVAVALRLLDPIYREVVHRTFFLQQPPEQIARELGLPRETIRTRLKRAKNQLRALEQLAILA